MIVLAASLLILAVTGWLVERAWFAVPVAGWVERGGRALMFGFGAFGCVSLAVDAAGLGVSRLTVGVPLLLLWAAAALTLIRNESHVTAAHSTDPVDPDRPRPNTLIVGLLAAIAILSLLLAVRSGYLRPTLQFDAVTRWMFKAKALAADGTLFGAVSTDPNYWFTHQRYPPLVSHVANLPALISGEFDDRIASALFPWFTVALTGVLVGVLRRRVGLTSAAAAAAWFASLPLVAYIVTPPPGSGAFAAMADLPLAMFTLGSAVAALDFLSGLRPRALWECGLLLGCAALTKNEGLPMVVALSMGVLVASPERRWRRSAGIAGLALLLFLLLWGIRSQFLPALDEHYPGRLTWTAFAEGIGRLPAIAGGVAGEMASLRNWNLSWLAILVMLAVGFRRLAQPTQRLLLVAVVVQLGVYGFALIISGWSNVMVEEGQDPVHLLMRLTLGRLLLHLTPLALCAAFLATPLESPREAAAA